MNAQATYDAMDSVSRAGVRIRIYHYIGRGAKDCGAIDSAIADELAGKPLPGDCVDVAHPVGNIFRTAVPQRIAP